MRRCVPGALLLGLAAIVATPAPARGWNIKHECGLKGTRKVRYLECSPDGFPGLTHPDVTDFTSADGEPESKNAMLDAYWMWDRDTFANHWLWVDQSQCYSGGEDGGWMNPSCAGTCLIESDDKTESWYEERSMVEDKCGAGAIGCAHTIRQWLGCGGANGVAIDEADVMVANDFEWKNVNQDTIGVSG